MLTIRVRYISATHVLELSDFCVRKSIISPPLSIANLVISAKKATPLRIGQTGLAKISRIKQINCDIFYNKMGFYE